MIHLYAIARGVRSLPSQAGVGGGRLREERLEDVVAVVSDVDTDVEPAEAAVAHGLVVEALAGVADAVLPVRFGERFGDRDALVATVAERLPHLRRRLDAVEGCVELAVHVGEPTIASRVVGTGHEYMARRLREARAKEELAQTLHRPLQRHARASVRRRRLDSTFVHEASYLVPREQTETFRTVVDEFAAAHPDIALVCTGPWAPYAFAEDGE